MKTYLLASLLAISLTQGAHAETLINGAGATFPFPLYSKWFSDYQKEHPDTQINYQSIGSGGGIRQFLEGTIDFGATDAPMTDEQLAKAKTPVLHIPTVLGAVVVTYNLPGIQTPLKLTGAEIGDIFQGKILKWNDPRIVAENPGVNLPDTPVLVVHRSDGSGTSAIFTDYLSKSSPEWKSKVGSGTAVNWPVGLGGKGNEGVTGLVTQTPGAVGYVELIYAVNNKLSFARVKNRAGIYVEASPKSVTAAAAGALKSIPEDFRVSITDAAGKEAYPISSFTYLLVYKKLDEKTKPLIEFLKWAMTRGQTEAEPLAYAPLPKSLVAKVESKIRSIEGAPSVADKK
jgi:phosphate transport system substrate-binding protein